MIKKIISHSFWLLIGSTIGRLSMFLTNIAAARLLSQEDFGQFSMIRNTVSMVEGLLSGSIGSSSIKLVAESSQKSKKELNTSIGSLLILNIVISLVLSFLIFVSAPFMIEYFFIGQSSLLVGFYIGALVLIATSLATISQNILIGLESFKKLALYSSMSSIISFPIILFLIYYYHLNGALIGVFIYFFIDFLFKYLLFSKQVNLNFNSLKFVEFKKIGKALLLFSSPIFLSFIIGGGSFWYGRIILINSTHSFKDIAMYDAAFQIITIIMILTTASTSAVLPMLSKLFSSSNKRKADQIFLLSILVNLFISVFIASIFIIFSDFFMSLYGEKYIKGSLVLKILSITSIFFSLSVLFNRYMISINISNITLTATALSSVVFFSILNFYKVNINMFAYSVLLYYITSFFVYFIFWLKLNIKKNKASNV